MKDWMESKELRTIIKLYVDDVREAPGPGWNVERTFHGAISFLERHNVHVISLDHDLACFYGNREMTGFDILNWLVARKLEGTFPASEYPEIVLVHSANPAVHDQMKLMIEKHWGDVAEISKEKGYSENDFSSSGC
jgi:hypothetical protein